MNANNRINYEVLKKTSIQLINFFNFSASSILMILTITSILCDTDPNSSYSKLQKLYMNEFENFFPLTKISYKKTSNQWFDPDLHTLLNNKEKLYKKHINNKNLKTRQPFTQARNLYFSTVKTKNRNIIISNLTIVKKTLKALGN